MNNQEQLNQLFSSEDDVDVKFHVGQTSDGTQALCGEALRLLYQIQKGELVESSVMQNSNGMKSK